MPNSPYDVEAIRADFPILHQEVYGRPLVFLDSAASAQKPRQVISAMTSLMENDYANVHRGVHLLSQRSTDAFEGARKTVADFIGANEREIVFTRNTTAAINLVADCFGRAFMEAGDEVVITELEHHANIVPWQLLAERTGIVIRVAKITDAGELDLDHLINLLSDRTKLVATAYVSNVLGTVLPVADIIAEAHKVGAKVLLDASQAVTHQAVDVAALDVDFLVFTGHKVYGPTGIGVLFGKYDLLQAMPPYQGGGDMIASVSFEGSTFKSAPFKFEAGTPAITEAVGLGAAIDWMNSVGIENIAAHEQQLLHRAEAGLKNVPGLKIYGQAKDKVSVVSFLLDDVHAHDVGTLLDRAGIAVRVGHHCAEPLMQRYGIASTARASFAAYNTLEEADALVEAVKEVQAFFG